MKADGQTQLRRVAAMLEAGPVCSTDLLREYIPRGGARVWDLRRAGYAIETRRCTQHKHRSYQIEYVLLAKPGAARQLALALEGGQA